MTDIKPQIQKAQRTLSRINIKNTVSRHIVFKLEKIKAKEKILKEARGRWKQHAYSEARLELHQACFRNFSFM